MRTIRTYDSFINESVIGKYTTLSKAEIELVETAKEADFGAEDTSRRAAIVKAIGVALVYFDITQKVDTDTEAKIISASGDDAMSAKLLGLAKTFVASLKKINAIEVNEIEPVSAQIKNALA